MLDNNIGKYLALSSYLWLYPTSFKSVSHSVHLVTIYPFDRYVCSSASTVAGHRAQLSCKHCLTHIPCLDYLTAYCPHTHTHTHQPLSWMAFLPLVIQRQTGYWGSCQEVIQWSLLLSTLPRSLYLPHKHPQPASV